MSIKKVISRYDWYCIMKGTKVILGADKSYKNTNVKKVNAQRAATH